MVVLSSSISVKISKMSRHECKGYKWQCPTTQSPTQQHNEPQRKSLGWPSDGPPPPPLGNDKGWGTTRGGGYQRLVTRSPGGRYQPRSPISLGALSPFCSGNPIMRQSPYSYPLAAWCVSMGIFDGTGSMASPTPIPKIRGFPLLSEEQYMLGYDGLGRPPLPVLHPGERRGSMLPDAWIDSRRRPASHGPLSPAPSPPFDSYRPWRAKIRRGIPALP